MKKIYELFKIKKKNILCIYFTAGYPVINSTEKIVMTLQDLPVDLIEIGIPYSDPLSDGPVIQKSNQISLKNGMNISLLFSQINRIKNKIKIPIILMGYYNQFYKFGEEKFLKKCQEIGISGLIFPDIPVNIFVEKYQKIFQKYSLSMIFLVTKKTDIYRISLLSNITDSFLYLVPSNSITGDSLLFEEEQISFFKRVKKFNVPKLIGFGIKNKKSFEESCKYANGGIIGSSFIQSLKKERLEESIQEYIKSIR
ncbi:tryptophan synthase subunit alpha [Blattabacterium sp. (Cryptocercus kyebangensis)]|uniref:tryptophan synthase subunit alpha n=1 Tax=Blattabacterium sp. (Cryptocercus kyebangensis) TaxID=298656 RepID=UPI000D7CA193|nr:tryptophan synthase subunit alpha [Blattabacterium sp. (Cryptocercus kyebangensis)]AWU44028.1 tryptophan synthase subunit alpha [Blattabacterium sp. (Cryptocercus kyebangensis)]